MAVFVLSGPPERAFRGFQADSFSCHQPSSHQEQVAGREQREELGAVLGKTALRASMGNSYGDQLALGAQLHGQLRRPANSAKACWHSWKSVWRGLNGGSGGLRRLGLHPMLRERGAGWIAKSLRPG